MSLLRLRAAFGVRIRHVEPKSRRRELSGIFRDFVTACDESPHAPLTDSVLVEEAFVALTERLKGGGVDFAIGVVATYLIERGCLNRIRAPVVRARLQALFQAGDVDFDAVRRAVRELIV